MILKKGTEKKEKKKIMSKNLKASKRTIKEISKGKM